MRWLHAERDAVSAPKLRQDDRLDSGAPEHDDDALDLVVEGSPSSRRRMSSISIFDGGATRSNKSSSSSLCIGAKKSQTEAPAPIYVLFRPGDTALVAGQLNIIDVVPSDPGYNDFWQVQKVTVPASYVADSLTSLAEINTVGYAITPTDMLVNCPVVPAGSIARLRAGGEPSDLHRGWYRRKVVTYFTFEERALSGAAVPTSPIYVMFNLNPDQPGGGPPSGFEVEPATMQTHNGGSALANLVGSQLLDSGWGTWRSRRAR
ncbi:MAG: hypothetical protein IT384_04145 [Deltaproteobacteria bacterium]|nr:hypothetical protein [Deltaproteobacteria bacterium]